MKVVDEEREDRNSDGKTAWMGIRDDPNSHEWVTFAQERVAWKELKEIRGDTECDIVPTQGSRGRRKRSSSRISTTPFSCLCGKA